MICTGDNEIPEHHHHTFLRVTTSTSSYIWWIIYSARTGSISTTAQLLKQNKKKKILKCLRVCVCGWCVVRTLEKIVMKTLAMTCARAATQYLQRMMMRQQSIFTGVCVCVLYLRLRENEVMNRTECEKGSTFFLLSFFYLKTTRNTFVWSAQHTMFPIDVVQS